jgi:hypothetical protein
LRERIQGQPPEVALFRLAATIAVGFAAPAAAEPLPPGCQSQFWMYGGLFGRGTTRFICDGPVQPGGSWTRTRLFYDEAYIAPARSSCSGGYYYSSCIYYPARQVEELVVKDVYQVTPTTILPDEPGHIL